MKRILLIVVLFVIILFPSLVQACTLAVPPEITLYHSAPSAIPESGSCFDEDCLYTIHRDEDSLGIIETSRYKEEEDWFYNKDNAYGYYSEEYDGSGRPYYNMWDSVIWISDDFEKYELSNKSEKDPLSIKEFVDMLEILLGERVLSNEEMLLIQNSVDLDEWNGTVVVDSDFELDEFKREYLVRKPNKFNCPIVSDFSNEANEIYAYDYSPCELKELGGMCPEWVKQDAGTNTFAPLQEYGDAFVISIAIITGFVVIVGVLMIRTLRKRLIAVKTQKAKTSRSSQ